MAESGKLRTGRDATDLIGEALRRGERMVVIPAERLDEDFFRLRTGVAGAFLQKFVTYRVRVAIVGDIAAHIEKSDALRDFVRESNRGDHVWFVADLNELEARMGSPVEILRDTKKDLPSHFR
jgi:hypothetical protein